MPHPAKLVLIGYVVPEAVDVLKKPRTDQFKDKVPQTIAIFAKPYLSASVPLYMPVKDNTEDPC